MVLLSSDCVSTYHIDINRSVPFENYGVSRKSFFMQEKYFS